MRPIDLPEVCGQLHDLRPDPLKVHSSHPITYQSFSWGGGGGGGGGEEETASGLLWLDLHASSCHGQPYWADLGVGWGGGGVQGVGHFLFEKILFICNTNCSRVSGWIPPPPLLNSWICPCISLPCNILSLVTYATK